LFMPLKYCKVCRIIHAEWKGMCCLCDGALDDLPGENGVDTEACICLDHIEMS